MFKMRPMVRSIPSQPHRLKAIDIFSRGERAKERKCEKENSNNSIQLTFSEIRHDVHGSLFTACQQNKSNISNNDNNNQQQNRTPTDPVNGNKPTKAAKPRKP